jgi:catechol 2,3-dioxygenase-like lactoylglutathione lyase family enzyme/DNA-binding CsgD family transcriptional regulator
MKRRGRPPHNDVLTPAEWDVANAVRHGLSNRRIAVRRGTSLDATRFHVANVLQKLGLRRKEELRHWRGIPASSVLFQRSIPVTDVQLSAIGQVSLTIDDVERAVAFYRDVLGMRHLYTFGDLAFFDCGGTRLFLTRPENGTEPRQNSVLYFRIAGIHNAAAALEARGVAFEGAPHLIHKHADGTEEWMAFFRDSEGNLLALMEQVPSA